MVVTGYKSEEITRAVEAYKYRDAVSRSGIRLVHNSNYKNGMSTSIVAGLREIAKRIEALGMETEAALIFPVDVPLVNSEIIKQVAEAGAAHEGEFIVPCFHGKKGHPLLIPKGRFDEILSIPQDSSDGMRGVMKLHKDSTVRLAVASEAVVIDMDTPEAYARARAWAADEIAGKHAADALLYAGGESKIARLVREHEERGGRMFLVRHGQIRQHKSAVFLGQSDVPLSNLGREEVREMVGRRRTGFWDFAQNDKGVRVFSSDLQRALESALIIAEALSVKGYPKVTEAPGLREISLGSWDGRYIEDIRGEFPVEFEERGNDIIEWKESGGENFYDLSYRVLKSFEEIISQAEGDVIIVSHAGPLRAIIAECTGRSIEETIDIEIPHATLLRVDGTLWEGQIEC
jgi:probable phosphoglycerate mutase